MNLKPKLSLTALFIATFGQAIANQLVVDVAQRGHDVNPSMYGIFFEEINHSGDGGLYAELIQNRGFEEQVAPSGFTLNSAKTQVTTSTFTNYWDLTSRSNTFDWDYASKKMTGWKVTNSGCSVSYDVETLSAPLHENTPNAMKLVISSSTSSGNVKLINTGYWGINVEKDAKYNLRFYVKTSNYSGKVTASILSSDMSETFSTTSFTATNNGAWTEYTAEMTASKSASDACFALQFSGNGTVYVDYVSLFPQDTYNGRENGLRRDLAQFILDLNPKFMRWPGGCIVEGKMLDNRVKWKETLGDPMTRPGEFDLWGYRCSWGLGYHEILQFCEDSGMDCMFVGNVGMSCSWAGGGDYVSGNDVEPFYQDIKDAIEYAIGDPDTNEWAAKRAAAGHPKAFPLKYVEIGNENGTQRYVDNFNYVFAKLKNEYPQLIFINNLGLNDALLSQVTTDMIDPHWYMGTDYFFSNRNIFDDIERGKYTVYVGEYACNQNVGDGNIESALAEAVFMMGMEDNSDLVTMASYAPLIENSNARNWTGNLIWQRSGEVFGRAAYYVQKLFGTNVPSYNVASTFVTDVAEAPYQGRIGLGTWNTAARYRNFKVSSADGKTVYYNGDFTNNLSDWTSNGNGSWTVTDGAYYQSNSSASACISFMNNWSFGDCTIEVEAMKTSGSEGFLIDFGTDEDGTTHYYQMNIGGWSNTGLALEDVTNSSGSVVSDKIAYSVYTNRWYTIKLVIKSGVVTCYINGTEVLSHDLKTNYYGRVTSIAGYDTAAGEVVLKVVNATDKAVTTDVVLNATNISKIGKVYTLAGSSPIDENTFEYPEEIVPVESTCSKFADKFSYTFEPYSFTLMRVKATPAANTITLPDFTFNSEPRKLEVKEETAEYYAGAALSRLINEANSMAVDGVPGVDALRSAITTSERVRDNATSTTAQKQSQAATLRSAMNTYCRAQVIAANEYTDRVTNPTINGINGWHGTALTASSATASEYWNKAFNLTQTIDNLPNGYYMVYLQAYYRNGSHQDAYSRYNNAMESMLASLVANNNSVAIKSLFDETFNQWWDGRPDSLSQAAEAFASSSTTYDNYVIAEVIDGKLTIKLSKLDTEGSDWCAFTNLRLFSLPTAISGITDVNTDTTDGPSRYFDLQGREIQHPASGIYIKQSAGSATKQAVK